jgi:hypothetical protein
VGVLVDVGEGVAVRVGWMVRVGVSVGPVGVAVGVSVAVSVGGREPVGVTVALYVGDGVAVGDGELVSVGVGVGGPHGQADAHCSFAI